MRNLFPTVFLKVGADTVSVEEWGVPLITSGTSVGASIGQNEY